MWKKILDGVFGGSGVKDLVLGVFDRIKGMSPEDRAKLETLMEQDRTELAKLDAELEKQSLDLEKTIVEQAAQTVRVDQGSEDWFVRRARPAFLWVMTICFAFTLIVFPLINIALHKGLIFPDVPDQYFSLFEIGFTGYVAGRSVEKTAKVIKGKLNA